MALITSQIILSDNPVELEIRYLFFAVGNHQAVQPKIGIHAFALGSQCRASEDLTPSFSVTQDHLKRDESIEYEFCALNM